MLSILRRILPCTLMLLPLLLATAASADESAARTFMLAPDTRLELSLPKTWKHQLQQPPTGRPILLLTPGNGNAFQVLVTPIWADRPEVMLPGIEDIRRSVTQALEQARPQAVEATLTLKEIMSSYARGYYFTATDKQPKEGEYKYMTQGMLRVGESVLMFTALSQDGGESVVTDAIELLKQARLSLPSKPAPAPVTTTRKPANEK